MEKNTVFFKKLFLPFVCMLALFGALSALSFEIGMLGRTIKMDSATAYLGSVVVFGCAIFLSRGKAFKEVFKASLYASALLLIASVYFFKRSEVTYFIGAIVCSKFFIFLGWAYVNQLAHQIEGAKYYFLLNFVASLTMGLFVFIPEVISHASSLYPILLLALAGICLWLIGMCHGWIQGRVSGRDLVVNVPLSLTHQWVSTVCLAILIGGMQLIATLNEPSFKAQLKMFTPVNASSAEYLAFMGEHSMIIGIGTIFLLVVGLLVGPKLLQSKGWKYNMLVVPIVGFLGLLTVLIKPSYFVYNFNKVIFRSIEHAWIFALVQIAFLAYSHKDRFFLQACVFLFLAPLLQLGAGLCNAGSSSALIVSFVIIGLMIASTLILGKNNKALDVKMR